MFFIGKLKLYNIIFLLIYLPKNSTSVQYFLHYNLRIKNSTSPLYILPSHLISNTENSTSIQYFLPLHKHLSSISISKLWKRDQSGPNKCYLKSTVTEEQSLHHQGRKSIHFLIYLREKSTTRYFSLPHLSRFIPSNAQAS